MLESTQHLGDDLQLRQRIRTLRDTLPTSVQLIAVSKGVGLEKIRIAYEEGLRHFGESRVQELQQKLGFEEDVVWHFIGRIQSNKARRIVEGSDWIHSVEDWDTALTLNRVAGESGHRPNILCQVKLASDPNKGGWSLEALEARLPELMLLPHLALRGVMTILPYGLGVEENRRLFQTLTQWVRHCQNIGFCQLTELSMGMSGDYPEAISSGATMVRLGQSLFGPRTLTTP